MTLTRREFIKHSGIAAGALVVTSAAPLPAWAEEKGGKILTAGRWGAMNVEVKDGKIVSSTGALAKTIPNSLQSTAADQVHTTARIQHPMVRKSYLDNPLQPVKGRGEDTYVQVSWEQALKLIHEQHDRIRKANGPSAIFAGSYGWRSSGVLHKAQTLLQRYMNLAGGYSGHSGDYSTGAAQVIMPHVVGSVEVYEQQTSWPLILENSQVVVLWGMNPLNTLKIAWSSTDEQGLEYFHQLKKSGKPVIAIDPICSETIEFFGDNATWIAPNMGTDVALMLGIAHTLMTQGKHDKVFLEKYTTGYPQFEEYLTGKSDNTPKSAAWAAEITGVPEAQIVKLAELMAANRTMLMAGWGIQRQQYGEQKHWMLVTLAAWLAIDWLKTQYGAPLRTVEVVAMAEEEGSRFPYVFWGSKNIFGLANPDDVRNICDAKGNSFVDAMKACGFTLPNAPLTPRQDIKAFVELHIEQGCVLESNGQSIGVVNAIVGQRRYTVTLNGESNHAGTTPMGYRRDTVYAFSRICHQSVEKAKKMGDPLVLTFGKVEPRPNTVNVVPGKTTFTIDCRHTDATVLRDFTQQLENDMRAICDEMDIGIDIDLWMDEEPVPMNKELVATLTELCESEKLNYRVMHSGAGHDAQIFAPRVPTCMIFIPSINGISHNPAERTNITDLAEGVKTLALMLYQLAWQK